MSTIQWTAAIEARWNELRLRELSGLLNAEESSELAALMQQIEQEESEQLADAIKRIELEHGAMRLQLTALQDENAELAKILNRQAV